MGYFSPKTFAFLRDLEKHNDRAWFKEHEADFEAYVREPSLRFITDAVAWFETAGIPYRGEAKKAGGALSRIHRDVRFSKDKSPYHTHMTFHFHHKDAVKDKPSPMIGIRFSDNDIGLGAGIWGGDTPTLNKVRDAIVADPDHWTRVKGDMRLYGDSLKTAPKGYDKDHPMIEDLRRKAYMVSLPMTKTEFSGDLLAALQDRVPQILPFCDFIHTALR